MFVKNWKENKYPLKFSSKDWNIFLNLLRQSNVHLFLRIINLNLKIIVNDQFETENDVATPAATTFLFESDEKVKEPINDSEIQSKEINDNKKESTNKINSSNLISLRSLNDCIEKVIKFNLRRQQILNINSIILDKLPTFTFKRIMLLLCK